MGQIVSSAAKPKRCNANQLSQVPTPAAGEHILVSSDNSMNAAGQGNFDCYIVGDGTTAASGLEVKFFADKRPKPNSNNAVTSAAVYAALYGGDVETDIDLSMYHPFGYYISKEGSWVTSTITEIKFVPIEPNDEVLIYATGGNPALWTIVKDNSKADNTSVHFATGYNGVITTAAGSSSGRISVPVDGHYLVVYTKSSAYGIMQPTISIYRAVDGIANNLNDVISGLGDCETSIGELDAAVFGSTKPKVNLGSLEKYGVFITSNNQWATSTTALCVFVPIEPSGMFEIFAPSHSPAIYSVLTSDSHVSTVSFATGYNGTITIPAGQSSGEITAPVNAHYIYVMVQSSAYGDMNPSVYLIHGGLETRVAALENTSEDGTTPTGNIAAHVGNKLRKLHYDLDENNEEIPETWQVLNIQRKAMQFTELWWTPKAAVPKAPSGEFPSGTPQKGIPYSSVAELDKYILEDVSLHTFMTAINNPYSLQYTENVSEANSRSAWGKTYHGTGSVAAYYGSVCTVLSSLCVGFPFFYVTNEHKWMSKIFKTIRIYGQSAQWVEIGDIVWQTGHCVLITGIERSSDGTVTNILISDEREPKATKGWVTASAFDAALTNKVIYRPMEVYRNTNYEPSPYVPVMDEPQQEVTYNNDICCFAGDMATFREGDTIAVNYNLVSVGQWTQMELYKDETLIDTIAVDTSSHVVDLTARSLAFGKYKARMKNGSVYSDYTYWEILKTNVTCTVDGGKATIEWDASGKAIYTRLCNIHGNVYGQRELTRDEIDNNTAVVDYVALNKAQGYPYIVGRQGLFIKVYFQGDYGRVTNIPLSVSF